MITERESAATTIRSWADRLRAAGLSFLALFGGMWLLIAGLDSPEWAKRALVPAVAAYPRRPRVGSDLTDLPHAGALRRAGRNGRRILPDLPALPARGERVHRRGGSRGGRHTVGSEDRGARRADGHRASDDESAGERGKGPAPRGAGDHRAGRRALPDPSAADRKGVADPDSGHFGQKTPARREPARTGRGSSLARCGGHDTAAEYSNYP
jgi:hypothetical protein